MTTIATTIVRALLGSLLILISIPALFSQTETDETKLPPKIRINGLGRTLIESTELGGTATETDTTTAKNLLDGEFLLDLKVNASPNEKTEVQTILRLRNEFGGFFGSGMSIEIRELFARGVVANVFRYHVGDMDLKMTPYTLFQSDAEGTVHEAEIFKGRRELIDYEQFYQGDGTRRMQGAKFDLGLSAGSVLSEINFTGFFTRVRGTDFFTEPSRYVGGGTVELVNDRWGKLRGNYVQTYDARSIGNFTRGIRNPVQTLEAEVNLYENEALRLGFVGEMGRSNIRDTTEVDTFNRSGTFAEGMFQLALKDQDLRIGLGYREVGPDFFSIAAQSKRVDFDRNSIFYPRIGNNRAQRQISLFDLSRDRNLYTFGLSDVLMPYDPRFSNVMPYGKATPNRRGITLEASYGNDSSFLELGLEAASLQEIRGQGTPELKNFLFAKVWGDFHLHRLIGRKEAITLTLGYQREQTSRGGVEIEQIQLGSNLLDAGLQVELFQDFDLLLGAKVLSASGSEYVPVVARFNEVQDFPPRVNIDDSESLLAAGFRYRFKEGVYLTAQIDRFSVNREATASSNYQIDQIFILYTMNF